LIERSGETDGKRETGLSVLSLLLENFRNDKIAIYGLSEATQKALEEIGNQVEVVGLLDGYRESGELFGKPILSLEEVFERKISLILVAARPGSCRAIARRIGGICAEHDIALFDVRGNNLLDVKSAVYDFQKAEGVTRDELMRRTEKYDAVSFDLFDTLVMRQTLFPTDVFELVDDRLRQHGIMIEDFSARRMASEKELSRERAPRLTEIYSYMKDTYQIAEIEPEQMAVLEWEIDCGLVVPRSDVCEIFAALAVQGKQVFIVSDSYYNEKQIRGILRKCGITGYQELFVSCEYETGKTQMLFGKYRQETNAEQYLHIGDDITADVECAEKNGVAAYRIYSGADLLELAGYMGLWDYTVSLSDRIRIGMFVSRVFNSPFQFETKDRRIGVNTAYETGYVFFAPMICDFVLWLREQVKEFQLKNILFCARDGYLVKQLYDELCNSISSIYFLTSRTAAIRAGMEKEEDIRYVGEMNFSGSLAQQLEKRFGIHIDESDERTELLEYKEEILERAARERKNYQVYLEKLNMKEGDAAFFDFVAKGTTQMYMGRLIKNHLKGVYFLRLDEEQMREKNMDIISFYKDTERNSSAIFQEYYILETMLTAPMPSVREFDGNGNPMYERETRSAGDIRCFQEAQEGIKGYFREYLRLCPISARKVDKKLDEVFLSMIHKVEVRDEDFLHLKVEDPFFNRMTNMMDMI